MYTASFFSTKFGRAALISIAAMLALNAVALTHPLTGSLIAEPQVLASSAAITGELA
jgi:hypothetical protein